MKHFPNPVQPLLRIVGSVLFVGLLWGVLWLSPAAAADVGTTNTRLMRLGSAPSDVGMMFMKMGGIKPDFDTIIKSSKAYKAKPAIDKADFLATERTKLETKFGALDPLSDMLVIRAAIDVAFERKEDGSGGLAMKFPEENIFYFPYYYGSYPIAVFINGIEAFQDIPLNQAQTADASLYMPSGNNVTLLLELKPVRVSLKKPVKLDGIRQYPLLTDISYIGLLNEKGEQIWSWQSKARAQKSGGGISSTLNPLKP